MTLSSGYSPAWFNAYADTVPPEATDNEVRAIARLAPPREYPRLLDACCGIGRVTRPLAELGYEVTGIDASVGALQRAKITAPGARFVALDLADAGLMSWTFDVAVVLWNSFGFDTREVDEITLRRLADVVRPGGRMLFDMYHPDWLASHEQSGAPDARGVRVDRWLEDGRSCHRMRYADDSEDDIRFNVYHPFELERMLTDAHFEVEARFSWWNPEIPPSAAHARYELVAVRRV